MPERKRKHLKKHDCSEVQGEGAYVILSSVKVGEIRKARLEAKDPEFDDFEGGVQMLIDHIVKWNFVDDDGNELALPKNNPSVIDDLTNEECQFLVDCMMGETHAKN